MACARAALGEGSDFAAASWSVVEGCSRLPFVVRLVGLDSENVGADGGPPEASGPKAGDLAVSSSNR